MRSLFLCLALCVASTRAEAQRPNIVLIYTDDQRFDEVEFMPHLQQLMVAEGVSMERFYAVTPACCPARATVLRGQYAHSHGVLTSKGDYQGGWDEWRRRGLGTSTLATWLDAVGYETGFYGKYINGYPSEEDRLFVPPGWDDWLGGYQRFSPGAFFNWRANYNGTLLRWGFAPEHYRTDVEGDYLMAFIGRALDAQQPFFAFYAPITPHAIASEDGFAVPPTPAPRHEGLLDWLPGLRQPGYDEADVLDKVNFIQNLPRLTPSEQERIDEYRRTRAESLLAVDDVVRDVIELLEARGALANTFVIFTSDNGFHLGEHRLTPERKGLPYEESVRMPMFIRGPGIQPGSQVQTLASNLDLAQTISDWAGAQVPDFVEGRSFRDHLTAESSGVPFRTALLNERWLSADGVPEYFHSIVTPRYKLTRWMPLGDAYELYDLEQDPGELNSLHDVRPELLDSLVTVMAALRGCSGSDCRIADRLWDGDDIDTTGSTRPPEAPRLTVRGPSPNPARTDVTIRIVAAEASMVTVRVFAALGQTLARTRRLVAEEGTVVRIPVGDFAPGVYLLEVVSDRGERVTRQFTVRR